MPPEQGLTQALAVSAAGIVMLIFDVFVLGMIVDEFVYYAGTWEVSSIWAKQMMSQFQIFGIWFYYIIFIMGCLMVAYPVIYIIKRHRYMDIEASAQDEATQGQ